MTKENFLEHPIVSQSFAIIDQEIREHTLDPWQYQIARRVIHTTADFEYLDLLHFSPGAINKGIAALHSGVPIVTDVNLVKQGIVNLVKKTFNNPLIVALESAQIAENGKTRSEIGMEICSAEYPDAIYLIGNAPTALMALCHNVIHSKVSPSLVIGAPVGFVSVVEAKKTLSELDLPQILVQGRKGGSTVAAAIFNALLLLAWKNSREF